MTYREALKESVKQSGCCSKTWDRFSKYMKNGGDGLYVPCRNCEKKKSS